MILSINGILAGRGADADALAFITAANITDTTQQSAITKLVSDLKSANIWSKMKAIYPFVGGTASSHKFNLKDPRDLDAAYRLVFSGGGTHSSTGYLGNGTNSYGRTFILQNSLQQNSVHLSYYNRYNSSATYNNFMGCISSPNSPNWGIYIAPVLGMNPFSAVNSIEAYTTDPFYTSVNKYWLVNRSSSTQEKIFINGVLSSTINKSSTILTSNEIYVGAINVYGNAGINEAAFASIGDSLTDAEATAFYNAVQTFNTTLGRQV